MTAECFTCPVCGWPDLAYPPFGENGASYDICPSCGFQFGVSDDDLGWTQHAWRSDWLDRGAPWNGVAPAPEGWDPRAQVAAVE